MSSGPKTIEALLASYNPDELREGLQLIKAEVARVGSKEAKPLFEMVSSVFYIDPLDHPELVPLLNEAISLVIGFGNWVIPHLVDNLDHGDLKAQMVSAEALGRIGADAVEPLIEKYHSASDLGTRAFVLYALGKIRSPMVRRAANMALEGTRSADLEMRDTATRAIGRFASSIPPAEMKPEIRQNFHDSLRANLADKNNGIRAKAVRSLGKLAKHGHLSPAEVNKLRITALNLLGEDENFEWDRAYVVRKEATEALKYCK